MFRYILLTTTLVLSGCASSPDVGGYFEPEGEVKEFCDLLRINVNASIDELVIPYGVYNSSEKKEFPNRHRGDAIDEVHTFFYKDGKVAIYSVPHIDRNYMLMLVFTKDFWPDFLPKQNGKTKKQLKRYFGKPDRMMGSDLIYDCAIEVDEYIRLNVVNDHLIKLVVKGWVD